MICQHEYETKEQVTWNGVCYFGYECIKCQWRNFLTEPVPGHDRPSIAPHISGAFVDWTIGDLETIQVDAYGCIQYWKEQEAEAERPRLGQPMLVKG